MRLRLLVISVITVVSSSSGAHFIKDTRPYSLLGGAIYGFHVVRDLPPRSALRKLGVQKGDVVLSVNNERITSEAMAKKAYENSAVENVVLLRKGRNLVLKRS